VWRAGASARLGPSIPAKPQPICAGCISWFLTRIQLSM